MLHVLQRNCITGHRHGGKHIVGLLAVHHLIILGIPLPADGGGVKDGGDMYVARIARGRGFSQLEIVDSDRCDTILDRHVGIHPYKQQTGCCLVSLRNGDSDARLNVPPGIAVYQALIVTHQLNGSCHPCRLNAVTQTLQSAIRTIGIHDFQVTFGLVTQAHPIVSYIIVASLKCDVTISEKHVVR